VARWIRAGGERLITRIVTLGRRVLVATGIAAILTINLLLHN
jgi:hypothetical protein